MREKELRLALVCYGGVSLAVYMHGIVKEAWKLLRASQAVHALSGQDRTLKDTENVYRELLLALPPHVGLRVMVDIVAGASAGGINGVLLAHAIAGGHDMEPLRDLWLENADVEKLLDPEAAPSSAWSKLYARPLVWLAGRDKASEDVDRIADPKARAEVQAKLSRFIRSRWFEPPFSGAGFTRLLYEAMEAMENGERTGPLLPPGQPLDLFVTTTDFYGYPEHLALNSPAEVVETEHRLVIGFRNDGNGDHRIGDRAALTFAARATASFPGAFPPFQAGELDGVLDELGEAWPGREAFLTRLFARRIAAGLDPAGVSLIDGSVLANAPFRPAIDALRNRPAHREVDRRFVYIDPKPGGHLIGVPGPNPQAPPGFFTAILHSLSNIPREQPIRDNLDAIGGLSRRVRRLRYIVAGMRDEVDAAIEGALGRTLFFYRPTPARLSEWRSRVQSAAATQANYAYAAYGHLKLSHIVEHLAETLAATGGQQLAGRTERVRAALWRWVRARGLDAVDTRSGRRGAPNDYVAFLRRYDLLYRVRRLRFLIRRLTELAGDPPGGQDPRGLDRLKERLYELLAPLLERRDPGFFAAMADVAATADADPSAALAAFGDRLGLTALDADTDARLIELLNMPGIHASVRRALILAYLGFPFFDIATLPLLQGEGLDEFDEIKVDRISPDDATSIRAGGAAATLKGIQFSGFGAFFSRAWRENDYLWGRLHAAERLIDIVLSTVPKDVAFPEGLAADLKRKAFRAIIEVEREHLRHVPDLCERLGREVG